MNKRNLLKIWGISSCFLFIATCHATVLAATFNVSTTAELRQALLDAAGNGQNDTIVLEDGTYATTDDGGGTFTFVDNEDYDLTLKGSSAENVILSGEDTHQVFKFIVVNHNILITLDSLSIINGYSIASNGGGFYSTENIIIQNCKILENNIYYDDHWGGGFYVQGSVTISNSTISNNSANASSFFSNGGGFCVVWGAVTISNSTISNNSADNGHGGGFFVDGGTVTVSSSTISNNIASGGGVNSWRGGGFFTFGPATLSNSIVDGNTAGYGGGFFVNNGNGIVTNTIISNNIAEGSWHGRGGGFAANGAVVKNSIIFGNIAYGPNDDNYGGGGFSSESEVTLINSIIINNGIDEGIYLYAETNKILNSVFINNGTNHINGDIASTVTVYNNFIDESKISIPAFKKDNINSGNLDFADQANGDFHIGKNSVLVDAGTINIDGVDFPDTDLDGNQRISGLAIDIGPYEYQYEVAFPWEIFIPAITAGSRLHIE